MPCARCHSMKEEWSQGQAEAEAKEAQARVKWRRSDHDIGCAERGMTNIIDVARLLIPNFIFLVPYFNTI